MRFVALSVIVRFPRNNFQSLFLALSLMLCAVPRAWADTWNNGTGTALWSSNGNWVDTSEPTINDPVIFNIGFPGGNTSIRLAVGELAAT